MSARRVRKPDPGLPRFSGDMYRLMVETSPTAKVLADSRGRIVLVNRRAEELFGYSREELLGRPVELLLPQRFQRGHEGLRQDYSRRPSARAMGEGRDLFARRKDGSEFPVEVGLNPLESPQGVFVQAAIVDISERKKSEERFRLAVEAAPNAMVMTDGKGRIVLVNAQAERLFGYERRELIGQSVEILVPPRSRQAHAGYRRDFAAKPATRAMGAGRDLFGVRKDGAEVPIEIGLNPIRTESETFILAAIVDITERRELQRRVTQSEALAAVGSMAAIVAHEIRNPLGSIVMAARSLTRGDLSDADRETVSNVLGQESQRLSRTLQDFLLYARPREPRLENADLNQLVSETAAALGSNAELLRGVTLELSLDRSLPRFPHDPDQLRQVLWNLLLNGVQAMDGKGRLRVSTAACGAEAALRVADSGPGLEPGAEERIFDPFFTTKKKGTGLGLAICRRIVQAHGGRIEAGAAPGGGALFSVLVPLRPPRPAA